MNGARLTGLAFLVIGVIIKYALDYESLDFLSGVLFGIGIGLIVIGKIGRPKT